MVTHAIFKFPLQYTGRNEKKKHSINEKIMIILTP